MTTVGRCSFFLLLNFSGDGEGMMVWYVMKRGLRKSKVRIRGVFATIVWNGMRRIFEDGGGIGVSRRDGMM